MPWAAAGAVVAAGITASSQPDVSGVNDASANASNTQAAIAQGQWNDYQTNFQPLEGKFVDEANNFTSPQNYDKAAGSAAASVNQSFGAARDTLARTPGIDPSSGAYQAGMTNLGLAQAATSATQQNAARMNTQNQGIAMQENALSLGKGIPATAAAASGSAAYGLSNLANNITNQNGKSANAIGSAAQSIGNGITGYLKPSSTPTTTSTGMDGFDNPDNYG